MSGRGEYESYGGQVNEAQGSHESQGDLGEAIVNVKNLYKYMKFDDTGDYKNVIDKYAKGSPGYEKEISELGKRMLSVNYAKYRWYGNTSPIENEMIVQSCFREVEDSDAKYLLDYIHHSRILDPQGSIIETMRKGESMGMASDLKLQTGWEGVTFDQVAEAVLKKRLRVAYKKPQLNQY